MRISIDGHHFDTKRAAHHWVLSRAEDGNLIEGDLYLSHSGIFYCLSPSQWANGHGWTILTAGEALDMYDSFLADSAKTEISEIVGIHWD